MTQLGDLLTFLIAFLQRRILLNRRSVMHCHMQNVIRMGPRVRLKMVRLQRARDRGRSGSESTRNKCTEIVSFNANTRSTLPHYTVTRHDAYIRLHAIIVSCSSERTLRTRLCKAVVNTFRGVHAGT